jgi:hypothetical protein
MKSRTIQEHEKGFQSSDLLRENDLRAVAQWEGFLPC